MGRRKKKVIIYYFVLNFGNLFFGLTAHGDCVYVARLELGRRQGVRGDEGLLVALLRLVVRHLRCALTHPE